MTGRIIEGTGGDSVIQFSVFMENKMGRLHEFTRCLTAESIHILAMTVLDTTDGAILRIVVDDPDSAAVIFFKKGYSYSKSSIMAVELVNVDDLPKLITSILAAEININYMYPFISRPNDKSALVLHLEDFDLATNVLKHQEFNVLCQSDISR